MGMHRRLSQSANSGDFRIATSAIALGVLLLATACHGGPAHQHHGGRLMFASTASAADPGEALYQQRCVACHQPNGQGMPGSFPPLAGSEYARAVNPSVPIRVVLHGASGPLKVKGADFNGVMPAYGLGGGEMSDSEVAAVLTYVRRSWGNQANAIDAEQVARTRACPRSRTGPVNAAELAALMMVAGPEADQVGCAFSSASWDNGRTR